MELAFDPIKSAKNDELRGLPFERAADFDFTTAMVRQDTRNPYPETRFRALGVIGEMVCLLVFTPIADGIRVISLRKASRKERRLWQASQILD